MSAPLVTLEQSAAGFVLHALWQMPLLAGAAWCAVRLGRPHVRAAHAIWVGTLLLCAVVPLCSTVIARHAAWQAQHDAASASITFEPGNYDGVLPRMQRESAWNRLLHRHVNRQSGIQPFAFAVSQPWARAIAWTSLLIAAFFALQLLTAWRRTRTLVRRSFRDSLSVGVEALLQERCAQLGLHVPTLRTSRDIAGPALAGVLHPVLLLPHGAAAEMNGAEIDAVLLHELAHLRRRDPLLHALCSLLLLPVSFHPVAWWTSQQVRQTREMACDAEAAQHIGSHAAYARSLLQVAERMEVGRTRFPGLRSFSNGLFGAGLELFNRSGAMEERMRMIMKSRPSETRSRRAVRVVACLSLGTVAVLAAGMLQVQPALAGERIATQGVRSTEPVDALSAQAGKTDAIPRLISGDHAREHLQQASRDLLKAEQQATNEEDRRKIATARDVAAAAEQALASANSSHGSPGVNVDLSKLDIQLGNIKVPDFAAVRAQMEQQRDAFEKMRVEMNSPGWKARMEQQQEAMQKLRAQMSSPEFRARIEAAGRINPAEIDRIMRDAKQQQEAAMEQVRSGAIQRQIEQATRLVARNEVPPMLISAAADPIKVSSAVMAGNALTKKLPVYPPEAKEKKIQGEVLLHAIISEEGKVEQLNVVSSPDEQLSKSAIEAVREWVYKPYLLNGEPKAVDTTITVHYSFSK